MNANIPALCVHNACLILLRISTLYSKRTVIYIIIIIGYTMGVTYHNNSKITDIIKVTRRSG